MQHNETTEKAALAAVIQVGGQLTVCSATLYIAGPMTGLPAFNYPAFHAAEAQLRGVGYRTLNPAVNAKPDPETWEGYMRAAIAQLIQAGGIALLDGWIDSRGARLEVGIAQALGMQCWSVESWVQHAPRAVPVMVVPE